MKIALHLTLLLLAMAQPLAAQGNCKAMLDAEEKAFSYPIHMYITTVTDGRTIHVESIYVGGNSYIMINGKWSPAGKTSDYTNLMKKKRQQHSNATCGYLQDEAVNGEPAAVYSMSAALSSGGTLVSHMWISKGRGVPLRQEDDVDSRGHKTHNSSRYEYSNVKAPM